MQELVGSVSHGEGGGSPRRPLQSIAKFDTHILQALAAHIHLPELHYRIDFRLPISIEPVDTQINLSELDVQCMNLQLIPQCTLYQTLPR